MKHKRITIFTALIFAILFFGYLPAVLAAPTAQILNHFVFLPIMVKPALLTPNSTNTSTSTPTLTPTPTNTSTPTPTLTLTPIATSILPGVQILQNQSHYVASGYLHVLGEIRNNTANNTRFIKITVNLFNVNGQLLDTDWNYIHLDNLPAGDRTCFAFGLPEPSGFAYYEFETPTYSTNGEPLTNNLTILNDSGSYTSPDYYQIIGQVRNDSGSRVEYVSPVGTLYNASSTVVGCDYTYVSSISLDPGQTSSFKIYFSVSDDADVTLYRLQVAP